MRVLGCLEITVWEDKWFVVQLLFVHRSGSFEEARLCTNAREFARYLIYAASAGVRLFLISYFQNQGILVSSRENCCLLLSLFLYLDFEERYCICPKNVACMAMRLAKSWRLLSAVIQHCRTKYFSMILRKKPRYTSRYFTLKWQQWASLMLCFVQTFEMGKTWR